MGKWEKAKRRKLRFCKHDLGAEEYPEWSSAIFTIRGWEK
jgi:hypothetical protein